MHQSHAAALGVIDSRSPVKQRGSGVEQAQQLGMAMRHGVGRQQSPIICEDDRFGGDAKALITPHRAIRHGPPVRRTIGLGIAVIDHLDLQIHGRAPDQVRLRLAALGLGHHPFGHQRGVHILHPDGDVRVSATEVLDQRLHQTGVGID
ncbi:hypothetical protein D3C85_1355930 [compost metagenome]